MKILLSQVSSDSRRAAKPTPKEQDEDHEGADAETKPPHGMVPESLKGKPPTTILNRSGIPGKCHVLCIDALQPLHPPRSWLLFLSMNKQPFGFIKAYADISRIL